MTNFNLNTFRDQPDEAGRFGIHGGRFVAETLMPLILDVERAYNEARVDKSFLSEMAYYQKHYIGRPSPLYFAERMTAHFGGAKTVDVSSGVEFTAGKKGVRQIHDFIRATQLV